MIGTQKPHHQMTKLGLRTARLCADAQMLFDSTAHDKHWEQSLLAVIMYALQVDADFQSWIEKHSCSHEWGYEVHSPPLGLAIPSAQALYVYYDIWIANTWMGCFSKRAHLHEVLLHCCSLLGVHPVREAPLHHPVSLDLSDHVCTRSQRIIDDMVYGVCASVPFMLGIVDSSSQLTKTETRKPLGGYLSIWHLHVARASCEEGSEREVWLESSLVSLSRDLGLRFAVYMARREKRERWNLR